MDSLRTSDLRALNAFLLGVYALRDLPAFRAHVVRALGSLVPSECTACNDVDVRRKVNEYVCDDPEPFSFAGSLEAFERHIGEHPLIALARTEPTSVAKISDFLGPRAFHDLGLYQEFFRPTGLEHQIAVVLAVEASVVVGLSLNRARADFSERDRRLLEIVRPHLIQAYRNAAVVSATARRLEAAASVLAPLRSAMIVVTRDGAIETIDALAETFLQRYFHAPSTRALPEALAAWLADARVCLAAAGVPAPLEIVQETSRLAIRAYTGEPTVLLLTETRTTIDPAALESLGLTRREAEALAWVARGKSNVEIGQILGVSPRTVQKHLQRVFEKLGVENRTAAAARAWETA